MTALPSGGFAGRGELVSRIQQSITAEPGNKAYLINIFGKKGVGKTVFFQECRTLSGSDILFLELDLKFPDLKYPENALLRFRQEVPEKFADCFALFDLLYIMRSEKVNGRMKYPPAKFFSSNSSQLKKVFSKYSSNTFFSRNFYKAAGEGLLGNWFEKHARKHVMALFQEQNQKNWLALLDAFADGLREYRDKTGRDPVVSIDGASELPVIDDTEENWVGYLMKKAGCGKFVIISEEQISFREHGSADDLCFLEDLTEEDGYEFFNQIRLTRESYQDAIYDNCEGNVPLMIYCYDSYLKKTAQDGKEPLPDFFESDPVEIVLLHLSLLESETALITKVLSVFNFFNGEMFEAVCREYSSGSTKIKIPLKKYIDNCFTENLGGGYFAIQSRYKQAAASTLDPDTLESVHYFAYQFHMSKLKSTPDYRNNPMHLFQAAYHGKNTLDVDGFKMWFQGIEKDYFTSEYFNYWLGFFEDTRDYLAGILGDAHPETSLLYDKMAYMYLKSGRVAAAEDALKKRLLAEEEKFGKNTAETVPSMNKLASVYIQTGDYKAAEAIMTKGLEIRETAYGDEHPEVADSLMKISGMLVQKGDRKEAVEYVEKASRIVTKVLGAKDEKRIESEEVIAGIYAGTNNMPKAVQLYKRLAGVKSEIYGAYDKEAVKTLSEYATATFKNGQAGKAVKVYEELLEKTKKIYGENSRYSAAAVNDLAVAYQKVREFEKAENMHNNALSIKDKIFGQHHPSTATSYTNFAQLKYLTGDLNGAESLYLKASGIYNTVFGREHSKTALGLNNLGFLVSRMGQFDRAEKYYKEALEIKEKIGESESLSMAATLNNLGELLYRMGRKEEAAGYLKSAFEIYQNLLGEEHETCQVAAKNLAVLK